MMKTSTTLPPPPPAQYTRVTRMDQIEEIMTAYVKREAGMPYLLLALLCVASALLIAWIPLRAEHAWMPVAALVAVVVAGVVAALKGCATDCATAGGTPPVDEVQQRRAALDRQRGEGVFDARKQVVAMRLQVVDPSVGKEVLMSTVQSLEPTTDARSFLDDISRRIYDADPGADERVPLNVNVL